MDDYRGDAKWAYLESVALNVGRNRVRSVNTAKRKSEGNVALDDPNVFYEPPVQPPDFAEQQEAALRSRRLSAEIELLPARQRQCIDLLLEDMSYKEIAASLRLTIDAVKSSIRDAKRQLRLRLGMSATLLEDDNERDE